VESDGVRVTVLDRTAPEGGGFRVRGEGSFLVEAPVGATVRMTVRDGGAVEDRMIATAGEVALGRTAVVPARVRAGDAHVSFALEGLR
jgi:hypothetical protein